MIRSELPLPTFRADSAGPALKAVVLTLCTFAFAQIAFSQMLGWQVEFKIGGTIRGLNEHLSINNTVYLLAGNLGGSAVSGHASPELMTKIEAWLRTAQPAKPDTNPIPFRDHLRRRSYSRAQRAC